MSDRHNYYMKLLEGRSKRLSDLLEIAAPVDIICKEVRLLVEAAEPLNPSVFSTWERCPKQEKYNENRQERLRCATG